MAISLKLSLGVSLLVTLSLFIITKAEEQEFTKEGYPIIVGGKHKNIFQYAMDFILNNEHVSRIVTVILAVLNFFYTELINTFITPYVIIIEQGQEWQS
ncbi:hypothetical protein C0J52_09633 [Blattella germanica]|nr:hypothetical protein C0J52_09633 [Blattella germanica]